MAERRRVIVTVELVGTADPEPDRRQLDALGEAMVEHALAEAADLLAGVTATADWEVTGG